MEQSAEGIRGNVTQVQTADNATIILGGGNYQTTEKPFLAPQPPDKFFGREKEIQEVTELLTSKKRIALIGPGGIGKTAIAAKVIEQLKGAIVQDGVVTHDFYQFHTTDDFASSIVRPFVSPDTKIEKPQEALKSVLNNRRPLVYLEGCEYAENIGNILILLGSCPLLMTSRDLRQARGISSVKVDSLDDSSSSALFSHHADMQKDAVRRICELLGNLPLALELAGSYLSENPLYSVEEFAELLEAQGLHELHFGERQKESIPLLLKRTSEKLNEQANLVWALLGLHPILSVSINAITTILNWNAGETIKIAGELHRYGLINVHNSVEYSCDSGKHISCKNRLIYAYAKQTLGTLLSEEHQKNYADHYLNILSNWTLGSGFENVQHFDALRAFFESALKIRQRMLGSEHPNTLMSINDLAGRLYTNGCYEEAEPLFQQVLKTRQRVLGKEHPDTLASQNNLAELLRTTGRYEEAEPLYRQNLKARRKVLGADNPDTLMSLNNLAALLYATERYEETEPLFKEALEARQQVLGEEHPDTLTSLNNLAALLYATGRYEEAEPLYRKTLETRQRLLGEEHPDTLMSLNNLADLLYVTKYYKKAEPLYRQALETSRRVMGDEHPDTLMTMNNLAMLLDATDRAEEAKALSEQATKEALQILGTDHPYTHHFQEVFNEITERQNN